MSTIGFFGDSFCESRNKDSWCILLADKLDSKITNFGRGGASIWHTFMQFEKLMSKNAVPDICVFCWTEPYRLYHPELPLAKGAVPIPGKDENIYDAADKYYVYLQNYDKDELAYRYALQWFDQHVLSQIKNKKIIQMWSMRPFELSGNETYIKLNTGKFIDESMLMFAWDGEPKDVKFDINLSNHMTSEQNQQWANKVHDRIQEN
jgi:hypothetical protein